MVFSPGSRRRRWTYSFRAYVDQHGWNVYRQHRQHVSHSIRCDCLKLWDLNWRASHHNLVRVTRGRRHLVILIGKRYRRLVAITRKA